LAGAASPGLYGGALTFVKQLFVLMSHPAVTVLMPVYNSERYVARAVKSILDQTFRDFEFLVINDGSTDGSIDIIREFDDPRIRVIGTENQGVAAALHLGMEEAKGAYIARMDADDESLPNRLEIEKRCLDEHPEIAVVHGSVEYIDAEGVSIFLERDEGHSNIITKWLLNWKNVPIHSTVMMRASILKEHGLNYRIEMNRAEDFDLWNRIARVGDFMYLPDVLIRYRIHSENVSNSSPVDLQFDAQSRVLRENLRRYGVKLEIETAQELVVISGAARVNPITYCYKNLKGSMHCLVADVSNNFCRAFTIDAKELAATQARQYLRWARYMLNTSRSYTMRLLFISIGKRNAVIFSYPFWAVMGGLFLTKK
jgi:glycosyltransferase involved in cell wall biosynthesis